MYYGHFSPKSFPFCLRDAFLYPILTTAESRIRFWRSYRVSKKNIEVTMSAIYSLSSLNSYRPGQGATLPTAQQAQRGTTYGTFNSNSVNSNSVGAARSSNTSAAYCPTCGGAMARSTASSSSSYCPTCNRAGGTQSNITRASTAATASQSNQGGRICVSCAYQGR